jgi:hypothetical protein
LSSLAASSLLPQPATLSGFTRAFAASAIAALAAALLTTLTVPAGKAPAGARPHAH